MLEGLKQALNSSIAKIASEIHIYLDNPGVAHNVGGILKSFSQKVFKKFEI